MLSMMLRLCIWAFVSSGQRVNYMCVCMCLCVCNVCVCVVCV